MDLRRALTGVAMLLIAAWPVWAGREGIHVAPGRSISFTWQLNDAAGYRWDIQHNGTVSDGSNDCYDGGMNLQVDGQSFSSSRRGQLSKDGREVEIGPWRRGAVQVWRRVYVDPKLGYCRWIDIFENTATTDQSITLRYYSNMGGSTQSIYSSSGKTELRAKDWAVVTASGSRSSRPAVVHVFASPGAKVRPVFSFRINNDNLYYNLNLKVPAGKTAALCFFEAQRRPYAQAREFLKKFDPRRELKKVPQALRRLIVNMRASLLTIEHLEMPRNEQHDVAVLRNGDELLGSILNEQFVIETFYGRLDLPAGRVLGLAVPAQTDPHVHVVLTDGQVVAGKMLNAPLRFKLAKGSEMALPPADLGSAAYRISAARPEEIPFAGSMVILRSGQRLLFRKGEGHWPFQTECGLLKLQDKHLRAIHLDTPEGGLHRAVFRNGSVLSGLMAQEDFTAEIALGPKLAIRRHLIERVILAKTADEVGGLTVAKLRNDDKLLGRIADESLSLQTKYGRTSVPAVEIAEIRFGSRPLNHVRIKQRNGTIVTGKLTRQRIRFQIQPGPVLPIFIGHVVSIICPAAEQEHKAKPADKPKPPRLPG